MKTKLIIVTGKGGVGKTTISTAMGYALAGMGKKTLVIEVGDETIVNRFFGVRTPDYNGIELMPNLWSMQVTPWKALEEYGMMKLHFRPFYNLVFGNPMMMRLLQALPGMAELLILGKIGFEVENQGKKKRSWDFVILDAPATGHGLGLLSIPGTVMDTMGAGPMAEDARNLHNLLTNKARTTFVIVTLSEQMPVTETIQHMDDLDALLGRKPEIVVANRMLPIRMNDYELRAVDALRRAARRLGMEYLEEVTKKTETLGRMRNRQDRALQMLESHLYLPVQQVPMVPADGLPRIQRIAGYMEDPLKGLME